MAPGDNADDRLATVEAKSLPTHVALCAKRNRNINARLRRLELAVYALIGVLLANGGGPVTAGLTEIVMALFR